MSRRTGILPSFRCVECGYISDVFRLAVVDIHSGTFCYMAVCPICGSRRIIPLPSSHEHDLRIAIDAKQGYQILNTFN